MKEESKLACIILAAGKGTRMKSSMPKVMHAVGRKPMLFHVIDTALQLQPETVLAVTSPDMASARHQVGERYKETVSCVVQLEQLGTGDAVKAAASLRGFTGIILILYGDTPLIETQTLQQLLDALKQDKKAAIAVLGMDVDGPHAYGRLIRDKEGYVSRIVEAKEATAKEQSITLCNSGVMAVRGPALFSLLDQLSNQNAKREFYLTDIVALARKAKQYTVTVPVDATELAGVNSRAELALAEMEFQQRMRLHAMEAGVTLLDPSTVTFAADTEIAADVVIHPYVVFGPQVKIESGVEIKSFSHIEGARILHNAIIGPFARLRPGSLIGENAHIGNFVEIKQTTVERGAKINHLSYVGDASVGESANVGAGTITCNFDGYAKHRTVIGAGAFIGSNTSLVAPVVIGERAVIGAGSVIDEDVEAEALAIARAPQKQKPGWVRNLRNKKSN